MIIVGGVEAVIHSSCCLVQDMDIVYQRSRQNMARIDCTLHVFTKKRAKFFGKPSVTIYTFGHILWQKVKPRW